MTETNALFDEKETYMTLSPSITSSNFVNIPKITLS